ncbi:MAG: PQQ-like beta-propeller repeat protein [Prevotellaceae bacterium]|jgi:outer membrane protein assembly factor BamB|nr:PQQ-like beta-propeller repeat protein [Prevotellaceae bacterium]
MKAIEKIVGTNEFSHFEIKGDDICFIDKNNGLNVIDLYTFKLKYIIPLEKCFYYETDDIYIYVYMKENGIYRVENGELKPYWKSKYKSNSIFNNYFIGRQYDNDTNTYSIALYDRITKNMIWQDNHREDRSIITVCDNLFIADWFKNPTYIENIDLQTGKIMWKVNFEQKVSGKILKDRETFIIPLKNNHLLGVNAQIGEKLWELEDCFFDHYLDGNTGLMYGYGNDRFDIVDVKNGKKLLQKTLSGSMEKYEISPDQNMNVLAGDYLYFVSNWRVSAKFGKINIHTQEIEFVQKLIEKEKGRGIILIKQIKYHNGRLYILDSVGTLHIFEDKCI